MSEPSQQLGSQIPGAKESKASFRDDVQDISWAIGSHSSACPAQEHPAVIRICWQPAPGSLSLSLSRYAWQALTVCGHLKILVFSSKALKRDYPVRNIQKPKHSCKNSLCCQFGFCTPFSESAAPFQPAQASPTALLAEPAALVPNLHVLLSPRENKIQEIPCFDFATEPINSAAKKEKLSLELTVFHAVNRAHAIHEGH